MKHFAISGAVAGMTLPAAHVECDAKGGAVEG
jgi:hypothetical protein